MDHLLSKSLHTQSQKTTSINHHAMEELDQTCDGEEHHSTIIDTRSKSTKARIRKRVKKDLLKRRGRSYH